MMPHVLRFASIVVVWAALPAVSVARAEVAVDVESGGVWFTRNDARIPNDARGTEVDLLDLTGAGPAAFFRLGVDWDVNERHGLRAVVAPLSVDGTGPLRRETRFADTVFPPGPTDADYRFNTYRITYRYTVRRTDRWALRVGFTGLLRDAEIALSQGELRDRDANVGFVPLLHLYGEWRISERFGLSLDFDGLAGGPGRAFDLSAKALWELTDHWQVGGGYRMLEGGADTDDVFSFAWLHFAVLSARYRF